MAQFCTVCDTLLPLNERPLQASFLAPQNGKIKQQDPVNIFAYREVKLVEDPAEDEEKALCCRYCMEEKPARGGGTLWQLEALMGSLHIGDLEQTSKKMRGNKNSAITPLKPIIKDKFENIDIPKPFRSAKKCLFKNASNPRKRQIQMKKHVQFDLDYLRVVYPPIIGRQILNVSGKLSTWDKVVDLSSSVDSGIESDFQERLSKHLKTMGSHLTVR